MASQRVDVIDGKNTSNLTEGSFVYLDEYEESCSEVALSYTLLIFVLVLLVVIVVLALLIVFVCLKYRRQYYTLLSERENVTRQESSKEVRKINDPLRIFCTIIIASPSTKRES